MTVGVSAIEKSAAPAAYEEAVVADRKEAGKVPGDAVASVEDGQGLDGEEAGERLGRERVPSPGGDEVGAIVGGKRDVEFLLDARDGLVAGGAAGLPAPLAHPLHEVVHAAHPFSISP